jgi:SAM-dependent methyltransferase
MDDPNATGSVPDDAARYADHVGREARHWAEHAVAQSRGEQNSWLDHPRVAEHYRQRGLIDGMAWEPWIIAHLGRPARRSLELGCGAGGRSLSLFERGVTLGIDGLDIIAGSIEAAEEHRRARVAPGQFGVADVNAVQLPPDTYDLIFSCHSFHHFVALEHVMDQVHGALTPEGLFVLEEYVGPTQFQWTDLQIEIVRTLTTCLPERLRRLRWGATKTHEGRPTPQQVQDVSPFESIRSGEIVGVFEGRFEMVATRALGGTLQHLLYNGIIHNFGPEDDEAQRYLGAILAAEDALIDGGLLPSDFRLLVGRQRRR